MSLIVQKYGGTSVANTERIRGVAKKVAKVKDQNHDVVVVVSAMAGQTDHLIGLAHQITNNPNDREMDMLLSTGERVTIALLAIALGDMGYSAQSFTGRQAGFITDDVHTRARIKRVGAERIRQALSLGKIAIVAGFQGITEGEDVTTLGRGGSDTTAVALAAALNAEVCEIYTDVDGVYTTDPNIVPEAKRLDKISYDEMLEMASLGAKVLQTRSVEFAKKYQIPVLVKSTFEEGGKGTLVTKEDTDMERVVVSGVAYDKNQAKVTVTRVPDKPGIAAKIFGKIAKAEIVVDMIIQNVSEEGMTDISFTIPKADTTKVMFIMEEVAKEIGAAGVKCDDKIAKVSIIGVGMRSHSGVAAKMFETLAAEGINIQMISTSEIKISCVIDSKYTELAVRALHETFKLNE